MRKVKILFLAANPTDTSYLRLGEEISAIDEELLKARFRDKFDLDQKHAVKADDLSQHLLQVEPDIVHFSGHGSRTGQIYLEDEEGKGHPVSERTLGNLFSVVGGNIRCVILNACYSVKQAEAISKHIDCVIGMSKAIGDEAAIEFAQGFYRGIGYGKDIETAFKLGCTQIDLQNLDEQNTPRILWKNNHPRKINFDQLAEPNTSSIKETTAVIEHEKNSARENKTTSKRKKIPSWKTLPGILAIITVAIIAITGLVVGFSVIGSQPTPTPTPTPTPQPVASVPSTPYLTFPPDGHTYTPYFELPITEETQVPIKLEWKKVDEADYYDVRVYYDSDPFGQSPSVNSTKIYWDTSVQTNSFEFNTTKIFSRHWWFVRSANNFGKSPWSAERIFYIQTPPS